MTDFVNCPHCGATSNIGGLVGQTTDDCPKCGEPVLTAPLEWQPLWDAMEAHPADWIQTTEKMYWEMLGAVPPRAHTNGAFLVGEASHSNAEGRNMYACFRKTGGQFYAKYLTIEQFKTEAT
jgi:hypothetical protein